jgi:magnesium-transporting ATPase (P-type)
LSFEQLVHRFDTSLTKGLNELQATNLLIKNGKNLIKKKEKHIFRKLIGYLFTGFCALLWVSSIVCFLAWKPIGDPPDPTNLGLGVLLIIVILSIIDMFFADFYEGTLPTWIPLWGGSYYSTPIFNFADAAIFCGVMSILLFQNKFLTKDH